jgi:preprotein translocase subunit SecE
MFIGAASGTTGRRAGTQRRKRQFMSWTTQARDFVKEVQVESAKISWPTRTELRDSTIVVIVAVLIVSAFVGIVDRVLSIAVGLLFR